MLASSELIWGACELFTEKTHNKGKERTMSLRLFSSTIAAVVMAFTCNTAQADITIGAIFSLTGPNSSLGIPFQRALALGPKEINGEKVRYVVLDDASDPSTAVRNARKLVDEEKVDIIVGPTGVPTALALANVLHELKVPMVSGAPIDVFGDRAHWIISVAQPTDISVMPALKLMKKNGAKTVAYIGYNDTWGDQNFGSLKKLSDTVGLQIVADERYARADTSVTPQIIKAIAARPDAIFIGASGTPGALPLIALAERNWKGQTYNTPAVFNQQFIQVGGKAVEGAIAVTGPVGVAEQLPETNASKAVSLNFIKRYEAEYGRGAANTFSAFCYDSLLVIAAAAPNAMQKAKPGTPEFRDAIRTELRKLREVIGTNGVFNFKEGTPYGVDERAALLVRIENGKWKLVE